MLMRKVNHKINTHPIQTVSTNAPPQNGDKLTNQSIWRLTSQSIWWSTNQLTDQYGDQLTNMAASDQQISIVCNDFLFIM